ncbi:unnamed protein product, partial [Rotaria socialis]
MLQGRYHPELADQHLSPNDEFKLLAQIYKPQINDEKHELLRQELLFSSSINAVKYLCSYESQTSTQNRYKLDDIKFLLPNTVRLSMHNKPSSDAHFLIKCGANLHRQPWHGTGGLRLSSDRGQRSISFETLRQVNEIVQDYLPYSCHLISSFMPQLAKLHSYENNNWDEYLSPAVFAYNTGIHSTTQYSHFQLQFGREPRLPIDKPSSTYLFHKPNDYYAQLQKSLNIIH